MNSALIAALLSILGKMLYHIFFLDQPNFDMYTRFFYFLCFLAAIFLGLRSWKIQDRASSFTDDIKSGLKIASIYAIVIAAFTWIYYAKINPAYFNDRITDMVTSPDASKLSPEELENMQLTAEFIFSPFTHSTLTLFGYMVMGLFYTIILVFFFRYRPKAFGI